MSFKDYERRRLLLNHFTENYPPHDEEFMKDLLMQCSWSKTTTTRFLTEMMKKGESTVSPSSEPKKDNATGQKTDSLSPAQKSVLPTQTQSRSLKLLNPKLYKQLVEREGVFRFTFYLGEVQFSNENVRDFAPRVFFESTHMKYLSERLNWWLRFGKYTPLGPLKTRGDGNCLLHAVSRGLIGVEDDELILREKLYRLLTDQLAIRSLRNRWRQQQYAQNQRAGLNFNAAEWDREWQTVLSLASPDLSFSEAPSGSEGDTGSPSLPYKSLEEIHVFALAHVIRRPIIVLANSVLQDVEGTAMSPVYFGGVYLPLDLDPRDCCKIPVVLTYCCSHFAPLIPCYNDLLFPGTSTEGYKEVVVPLVDHKGEMLPIQFQYEEEKKPQLLETEVPFLVYSTEKLYTLRNYLYVETVPITTHKAMFAAKMFPSTHEFYGDIIASLVKLSEAKLQEYTAKKARELKEKEAKTLPSHLPVSPRTHEYYPRTRSHTTSTSSILPSPVTWSKEGFSSRTDPQTSHLYSSRANPPPPTTKSYPRYQSSPSAMMDPLSRAPPVSTYFSPSSRTDIFYKKPSTYPSTTMDPLPIKSVPLSLEKLSVTPSNRFPITSIDNYSRFYDTPKEETILYPPRLSTNDPLYSTDQISTHSKGTNTDFSLEHTRISTDSLSSFPDPLPDTSYRRKSFTSSATEPYAMAHKSSSHEYSAGRRKELANTENSDKGELLDLCRYIKHN